MHDLEETPILGEVLPLLDLPEVWVPLRKSGAGQVLFASVSEGDGPGEAPDETGPGCVWCSERVGAEGDTCCWFCYVSWFAWKELLMQPQNIHLVELQPDEAPPRDLHLQPWYERMM